VVPVWGNIGGRNRALIKILMHPKKEMIKPPSVFGLVGPDRLHLFLQKPLVNSTVSRTNLFNHNSLSSERVIYKLNGGAIQII
jgi:hypothetical protein